jgi:hypothetical protein
LSIPSSAEGRPTFKLDLIAPTNGISHGKALRRLHHRPCRQDPWRG